MKYWFQNLIVFEFTLSKNAHDGSGILSETLKTKWNEKNHGGFIRKLVTSFLTFSHKHLRFVLRFRICYARRTLASFAYSHLSTGLLFRIYLKNFRNIQKIREFNFVKQNFYRIDSRLVLFRIISWSFCIISKP